MPPAASTLGNRRMLAAAGVAVGLLAVVAVFASLGGPQNAFDGLTWVIIRLARAAAAPTAYIVGAAGLGRLARPLFRGSRDEWAMQLAIGLGIMLTLSHALGVAGLFGGSAGRILAIGIIAAGALLLAHQLLASGAAQNASMVLPLTALPAFIGAALLVVAACNPPGWLWDTEFGGFDALEYHLQLPQEWLARGRLWPLNHNVYSFLPGYVEGAFYHLGAVLNAPLQPTIASPMIGLVHGDGSGVIACQLLHAGLTLCAAVLVGRATRLASERCGLAPRAASTGAGLAASLFILTPWIGVVGSMAYNESAVLALGAGALAAAMDDKIPPARRAILTGLLVGIACGAKPTALTMIGAPVGLVLLGLAPRREWPQLILAGALAGSASLAPWLARNGYACGNPVFPFLTSWFGDAHWTPEQVTRYIGGHSFDGSMLDRFRLMVLPDAADPAGPAHRGILHQQWFLFFPLAALTAIAAIGHRSTRCLGAVLALGLLAQLGLWSFTTHIQSRFLIPLAVTGSVAFGLASAAFGRTSDPIGAKPRPDRIEPPSLATAFALIAIAAQGIAGILNFAHQRGGHPNARLMDTAPDGGGVQFFSGQWLRPAIAAASEADRRAALDSLPPFMFINLGLRPELRVYLLGDSTPLYLRPPLIYHTTWDASPLGLAIRANPGDSALWTAKLRAEGVELVLVNLAELARLHRSGWYDPDVTPEAVQDWLSGHATLIRAWPDTGAALFQLAPADAAPPRNTP